MAPSDVYVLVFDGFADWEPAYALAELRRSGKRDVVVVGFNSNPVISMGGLRVLPDRLLDEVAIDQVGILILPGGERWTSADYPEPALSSFLKQLEAGGIPIAAICGATLALARAGLLNDRRHTSSVPGDLNSVPEYSGAAHYLASPAVTDRGIITASGLAAVDFAGEVLRLLGVLSEADQAMWFDMYKSGRLPGAAGLGAISPFFIVKDLRASIAYYIERLGFELDFQGPADDVYYAGVKRDGIGIMLKAIMPGVLPQPNHTRHAWARWDAYIYTMNPDALFDEFTQRGATFVQPLSFIDDGLWGFEVSDADGYVIAFFRLRRDEVVHL